MEGECFFLSVFVEVGVVVVFGGCVVLVFVVVLEGVDDALYAGVDGDGAFVFDGFSDFVVGDAVVAFVGFGGFDDHVGVGDVFVDGFADVEDGGVDGCDVEDLSFYFCDGCFEAVDVGLCCVFDVAEGAPLCAAEDGVGVFFECFGGEDVDDEVEAHAWCVAEEGAHAEDGG